MENKLNGFNNGRDTTDGVGDKSKKMSEIGNDLEKYKEVRDIALSFADFRIKEREDLLKLIEQGKPNVAYTSFDSWYINIYKKQIN